MGRVIFITLSKNGVGLWLRYSLSTSSGLWLSVFGINEPIGYRVLYPRDYYQVKNDYDLSIGTSRFSLKEGIALGITDVFSWNLKFNILEGIRNPVPPLLRILRNKYLMLTPLALFNGYVTIKDKEVKVDNYRGMIGFTSTPRELNEWVWAHCSGFDEDDLGWLDLLVTGIFHNTYLGIGLIKVHNQVINIGGFYGRVFKGSLKLNGLKWVFNTNKGKVEIYVNVDPRDMIVAEYEDVGGNKYCHNTEIADLIIRINNEELSCKGRAFFEYGITKPLLNNRIITA
ncbi:MAG: hypothetical protein ACP5GZ_08585 [Vulcanisaeta sp.]|uniref:hypothetical protein n=1 Tax=Vulcanisaeta sp. TaxID=2020871 RepID=UPI003D0CF120